MAEHASSAGKVLRLRERGLEWRVVDDQVVGLDLEASVYLGANSSAALLWDALARGATEAELVHRLVARYGLPLVKAAADVRAFIAALDSQSLLAP